MKPFTQQELENLALKRKIEELEKQTTSLAREISGLKNGMIRITNYIDMKFGELIEIVENNDRK